mmetsp:Transcript_78961/g.221329  ORF Transcript_78961/g.221329 Transcript_78961/m.221329 type:complete len:396 (-) Transcript_78961:250-1437(-)
MRLASKTPADELRRLHAAPRRVEGCAPVARRLRAQLSAARRPPEGVGRRMVQGIRALWHHWVVELWRRHPVGLLLKAHRATGQEVRRRPPALRPLGAAGPGRRHLHVHGRPHRFELPLLPLRVEAPPLLLRACGASRQEGDHLAALGTVHREFVGVLRQEVLQALVGLLQVQAGASRECDSKHAEQKRPLTRRRHVLPALFDDVFLGHAQGLEVVIVVASAHLAVGGCGPLEAELVRPLSVEEDLHIAVRAHVTRSAGCGRRPGQLHDAHVQLLTGGQRCLRRGKLHTGEARGTAIAIQNQLYGVLVLQRLRMWPEKALDVGHRRAVWEPAELHRGLVLLLLLLLRRLRLRGSLRCQGDGCGPGINGTWATRGRAGGGVCTCAKQKGHTFLPGLP